MNSRKILLVVPYRARDLESHALVGYYLERRHGHEVIYTNGYGIEKKILAHSPDVVVLDHLSWNFKVEQAKLAKSLGMKIVILPTEGLFQDEEGAVRRSGKLHNASHLPDKYLTWGDFPRRALLKQKLMTEDQVVTIGCPRFDFYKPPFSALFNEKSRFLKQLGVSNPEAPLVLWATNTSYASRNPKKMLDRQTRKARKPLPEVQDHIADHLVQFKEHSALIENLAKRNPNWNFLIKVHPAEWVNPYLEISERNSNIKVAFDAPIREFLYHADVLLQRNCTTATEAWMLGKPTINLEIGKIRRPVRNEYSAGNKRVYDIDAAEKAISNYLNGAAVEAEQLTTRDEFLRDFYFRVDGKSGKRAAAVIDEVVSPPNLSAAQVQEKDKLTFEKFAEMKKFEEKRFVNRVKDLLRIDRSRSLRIWEGWLRTETVDNAGLFVAEPEITSEMVDELYCRFDEIGLLDETDREPGELVKQASQ